MKVKYVSVEGGDWHELHVNGHVHASGHSIAPHEWLEVLTSAGAEVEEVEWPTCTVCEDVIRPEDLRRGKKHLRHAGCKVPR